MQPHDMLVLHGQQRPSQELSVVRMHPRHCACACRQQEAIAAASRDTVACRAADDTRMAR